MTAGGLRSVMKRRFGKVQRGACGHCITLCNVAVAADRIDYWILGVSSPAPPGAMYPALDRSAALTAIGRSLRDQYDALAAPLPPNLAALVKRLEAQ
jgi:hypothetical protein